MTSYKKSALLLVLVGLLPISGLSLAQSASKEPGLDGNGSQVSNYQAQIADIESEFGPYSAKLAETLESLASAHLETQDYESLADIQNRQLQIARTNLGFEDPQLIPLLHAIIENQIRLGEWDEIEDHLKHIRQISSNLESTRTEQLLQAMDDQVKWLYANMYLGSRGRAQAQHFLEARDLVKDMNRLAEKDYGEDDPKMIPLLYERALVEYRLFQIVNSSNVTASETIREVQRREGLTSLDSPRALAARARFGFGTSNLNRLVFTERGEKVGERLMRNAMRRMDDIADIAEIQGDTETQAMALLYKGDFRVLASIGGRKDYRKAQELFQQAGIAKSDIDAFFAQPSLIPNNQFYHRLDNLAAATTIDQSQSFTGEDEQQGVYIGEFTSWSQALASTPAPRPPTRFQSPAFNYHQAQMQFSVSSQGSARSVKTLSTVPGDERRIRAIARNGVKELKFRPAFIDGKPQRSRNVLMHYYYIPEK